MRAAENGDWEFGPTEYRYAAVVCAGLYSVGLVLALRTLLGDETTGEHGLNALQGIGWAAAVLLNVALALGTSDRFLQIGFAAAAAFPIMKMLGVYIGPSAVVVASEIVICATAVPALAVGAWRVGNRAPPP